MNMKKKLIAGSMSAALGLSLVAGGTFAAFNDVEGAEASFEAGTLKMDLHELNNEPFTFDISNLKPGDWMERDVQFKNKGSLAIQQVLMAMESVNFNHYEPTEQGMPGWGDDIDYNDDVLEYLDQFQVTVMGLGIEEGGAYNKNIMLEPVSLKDFYLASDSIHGNSEKVANGADSTDIQQARQNVWANVNNQYIEGNRINVVTENNIGWEGLPVDPTDHDGLRIKVEFKDDQTKDENGEYVQNKFQGNQVDIRVSFEATQWPGQEYDGDGYIEENERTDTNRDGTNH